MSLARASYKGTILHLERQDLLVARFCFIDSHLCALTSPKNGLARRASTMAVRHHRRAVKVPVKLPLRKKLPKAAVFPLSIAFGAVPKTSGRSVMRL